MEGTGGPGRIPWMRLAVEGILIVVSILAAFGIDAWWDARTERVTRETLLENLRQDFQRNLFLIDSISAEHGQIKAAARELMQFTGPGAQITVGPDSIGNLIVAVTVRHRFRPAQGSLASALNSGRWELLTNAELQAALTDWPIGVADLNAREEEGVEGINNRLLPRLWQLAPIRNIDMLDPAFHEVGPSRFPLDYRALLSDMVFEGAVDERWWDSHSAMLMLARIREDAERIVGLIDEAIQD
jgi:hypothetical protein